MFSEKLEQPSFEYKRSKKPPKRWQIPFENYYKGADKSIRGEQKNDWEKAIENLIRDINNRAEEMKNDYSYPDKRQPFQNNEFFLKKAWDEFAMHATEEIDEIVGTDKDVQALKEIKNPSNTKRKKLEKEETNYLKRKIDAEGMIKKLIPNFYELDKEKQLDLLDQIFEDIKEKYYGDVGKKDVGKPPTYFSEAVNKVFKL